MRAMATRKLYHEAGADVNALTSDEPGVVRTQKGHYTSDILRRPQPSQRMARDSVRERRRVSQMLRRHVGCDVAGRHRIHQNLARGEFQRPVGRQGVDRRLRRAIQAAPATLTRAPRDR